MLVVACGKAVTPGAPCRTHDDCKSLTDGWCARVEVCTRACDHVTCPSGSTCVTEGARRVCLASCDDKTDCLKHFVCNEKPEGRVCEFDNPLGAPPG